MIKNIIFDVGNVLMKYDPDGCMERLGFDEKEREEVNKAMFQDESWNESDRGVLTSRELLEEFISHNPAYEAQIRCAYAHMGDTLSLMPHALPWVEALKKRGYHLYILSNYAEYTFEQTEKEMKFLPYMDGEVFSFRCKMIKPEREIYEYLCRTYDLVPEESVFLDDRGDNIEAARAYGLHGIVFESFSQASEQLEQLLSR